MSSGLKNLKPAIIWDWNGTLLDDVDVCVKAMNKLLDARGLPALNKDIYRDVFRFPVQDYYREIGFNFEQEAFEIPALEFMQHYQDLVHEAGLFSGVHETLMLLKAKGVRQFVLSAMEQKLLNQLLQKHQLTSYFEYVQGIEDHFANGKMMAAQKLNEKIAGSSAILIGDSLHDAEVGTEYGYKTVLFSGGHFSDKRLKQSGLEVLENFSVLNKFLLKSL